MWALCFGPITLSNMVAEQKFRQGGVHLEMPRRVTYFLFRKRQTSNWVLTPRSKPGQTRSGDQVTVWVKRAKLHIIRFNNSWWSQWCISLLVAHFVLDLFGGKTLRSKKGFSGVICDVAIMQVADRTNIRKIFGMPANRMHDLSDKMSGFTT